MTATVVASLSIGQAVACAAPFALFQANTTDSGNALRLVDQLIEYIKDNSPKCRYRIIGRADVHEPSDLALQRADFLRLLFVARGLSRDQFAIETEPSKGGELSQRHPDLAAMDRVASIHSARQEGRVKCLEPMTTCPVCTLTLPDGSDCKLIPGSGATY